MFKDVESLKRLLRSYKEFFVDEQREDFLKEKKEVFKILKKYSFVDYYDYCDSFVLKDGIFNSLGQIFTPGKKMYEQDFPTSLHYNIAVWIYKRIKAIKEIFNFAMPFNDLLDILNQDANVYLNSYSWYMDWDLYYEKVINALKKYKGKIFYKEDEWVPCLQNFANVPLM